jgi:hypothetical protein
MSWAFGKILAAATREQFQTHQPVHVLLSACPGLLGRLSERLDWSIKLSGGAKSSGRWAKCQNWD